ncbi:MAG: glycosyltransferase family 4 protein [bacterium]|nr:glycosyltransferase family 4 protein [bacterium]
MASPLTERELNELTGPHRKGRPFWYHYYETPRRIGQLLDSRGYDVVVVQKAAMTAYLRGMDRLVRACARRLVYDIDDAVHVAPPHPLRGPWRLFEDRKQALRLMARADLVLAGNAWLRAEAEAADGRAVLFPTVVDTHRFTPPDVLPEGFRVGWIGNPSTTTHLAAAAGALSELPPEEVTLVGADPAKAPWSTPNVEPWTLDSEVSHVQHFTVGIMPLPDDVWSRGKCALKALQYMACGVPCVASPVGVARDLIQHDGNGLLADSPEEWRAAIEQLRDPAERNRLGAAGRRTVEREYALRHAAPRLHTLLEEIA